MDRVKEKMITLQIVMPRWLRDELEETARREMASISVVSRQAIVRGLGYSSNPKAAAGYEYA
jgi:hypothetical protein